MGKAMKRAIWKQSQMIMIVLMLVAGCAQPIHTPTAEPAKIPTTVPAKTPTNTPAPTASKVFTPAPTEPINEFETKTFCGLSLDDGSVGGLSGVFVHPEPPDGNSQYQYNVLRLYPDGLVFFAYLFLEKPIAEAWPDLKPWFNRESVWFQTQSKDGLELGQYQVVNKNRIVFTTSHTADSDRITIDYCGSFTNTKLTLTSYNQNYRDQSPMIEYDLLEGTEK